MSFSGLSSFDKTIHKTNLWLNELDDMLGIGDKNETYHVFMAVLHGIRDRLTMEEAVHVGSHLPTLLRGAYYQGWKPSKKNHKIHHVDDFVDVVESKYTGNDVIDFAEAVPIVISFLSQKISEGEVQDIKATLPLELEIFWDISETY